MKTIKYPFLRPELAQPEEWMPIIQDAYDRRYFTNNGPISQALEKALADKYAAPDYTFITTNSATSGLMAALLTLSEGVIGNEQKRKVVIPAFTFPATMQAVIAAGFEPVLCDVSSKDAYMCEKHLMQILEAQGDEIWAVMPVRVYGSHKDLSSLLEMTKLYKLPVIVDAAAALPSSNSGIRYGANYPYGYMEVFSFHATKVFGIGEGGGICCSSSMAESLRERMNFGFKPDRSFVRGFNGKMDEFAAARGLALLKRFDDIVQRKHKMAAYYKNIFAHNDMANTHIINTNLYTPYQAMPIRFEGYKAAQVIDAFLKGGIEIKQYYTPCLSTGAHYKEYNFEASTVPTSQALSQSTFCLPVYSVYDETELVDFFERLRSVLTDLTRTQVIDAA